MSITTIDFRAYYSEKLVNPLQPSNAKGLKGEECNSAKASHTWWAETSAPSGSPEEAQGRTPTAPTHRCGCSGVERRPGRPAAANPAASPAVRQAQQNWQQAQAAAAAAANKAAAAQTLASQEQQTVNELKGDLADFKTVNSAASNNAELKNAVLSLQDSPQTSGGPRHRKCSTNRWRARLRSASVASTLRRADMPRPNSCAARGH